MSQDKSKTVASSIELDDGKHLVEYVHGGGAVLDEDGQEVQEFTEGDFNQMTYFLTPVTRNWVNRMAEHNEMWEGDRH